ncbi:UpxY family transcription antiterminator [Pontibacter sp. MBLB2868]|uniref:UpxY family transcription antiterminator n=1 Tax=Pontibacter sp. MBLB2868 TaxID=3451555 RepID=UPI003F74F4D2
MNEKWYAIYTKPRWEKKVAEALSTIQVTNYCPLNKVVRQWSDRKKTVYVPLFTSYVFVNITDRQLGDLKKVNGVISFVSWLGKPAVIKDDEIDKIKRFLGKYEQVKIEKNEVQIDDKVKITQGTLLDKEGTVLAFKNNLIKVALPSLGYTLIAEVDRSSLEKVPQRTGS